MVGGKPRVPFPKTVALDEPPFINRARDVRKGVVRAVSRRAVDGRASTQR